jgi:hypothetical protein
MDLALALLLLTVNQSCENKQKSHEHLTRLQVSISIVI